MTNHSLFPFRSATPRGASGFTLLEIIIVVGLIAALAGALIVGLTQTGDAGRIAIAQQFVDTGISPPLEAYKLSMGSYPSTEQGLQALVSSPGGGSKWRGPYLDKLPLDPWGQPYHYRSPGTHNRGRPDIWSGGPDQQNNDGSGDDVANWSSN